MKITDSQFLKKDFKKIEPRIAQA
jgi:hypothetical protein